MVSELGVVQVVVKTMEFSPCTSMIKLVASDYSIWKLMIEDLLYCKVL